MSSELEKLLKAQEQFLDVDISEDGWDKIKGEAVAGGKIEIKWKGREFTDKGYFFALPDSDIEIGDICVHIPSPDNSDGIGDAPPVWVNLYEIVNNEQVKWVKCT